MFLCHMCLCLQCDTLIQTLSADVDLIRQQVLNQEPPAITVTGLDTSLQPGTPPHPYSTALDSHRNTLNLVCRSKSICNWSGINLKVVRVQTHV